MPNHFTVRRQPHRSPIAPKTALTRMLVAKTATVMARYWDWLQPWPQTASAVHTVGSTMNMPNCGAVLISRIRKPIRIRLLVAVSRMPAVST